jgi:tetratricopeptide (TPR) repeat protein
VDAPEAGGMSGEIAEGILPELLRALYVERRTGRLHLVRGEEEQSLRFRAGHIVNATTNVKQDRLGEMLVRRGLLKQADLVRATEVVERDKRRLGEVLAELGLLDKGGLEDAIALHVHEMLARLFTWPDGLYLFKDEADQTDPGEVTLKLSTGELILEAVRAVRDPDVVRYALGDIDRVLSLSSDPLLRFQQLTLSPADGFVLSRVDGVASAREILQMIPLPVEETQKSLFGLLSTGVIEYAEGQKRKRDAAAPAHPPREAVAAPLPAPTAHAETPAEAPVAPTPPAPTPPAPAPPPAPPVAAPSPAPAAPPPSAAPAPPPAGAAPATAPAPHSTPQPSHPPPPAPAAAPATAHVAEPPAAPAAPLDPKAEERRREILEAWEGLKERNHFEVLGLQRAVGEAEVKEAYFRLAKRFHPDVHHGASLGDLRDKLEAVFIRLGEAYDTLRDPKKRADYEERLGRFRPRGPQLTQAGPVVSPGAPEPPPQRDPEEEARLAEDALRKAAKLLEHARALEQEKPDEPEHQRLTYDAIQLLEPVLETLTGKSRLRAQLLLARGYSKNPKWAKRAEELLIAASREVPQSAEPWALLGSIYAGRGIKTRAVSMYKKALELKPDHEEAGRYLAENAPPEPEKPEAAGGGLLGRFFKKS